jgi:hypothetical protein
MVSAVLFLAPALTLGLLLLARCYPGERRLAAVAARRRPALPRAPARARICPSRGFVAMRPRGGALIALSLATRPPPALLRG